MSHKRVAIVAIVLAGIAGSTIGLLPLEEDGYLAKPQSQAVLEETRNSKKPVYQLAEHEDKLAVFIIGKEGPEIIFDVYLHYLPDVDRLKLEDGIDVYDYEELLKLIEDYTS